MTQYPPPQWDPPAQGSHPPHPYGVSGPPGYYGPPPAVHVHLPPKKRAVWPWIVLLLVVILPFAGCAGLVLVSVASRPSADDTGGFARRDSLSSTYPSARPTSPPSFAPSSVPTTTTRSTPRQITYSVTGTKEPGDVVTVAYTDAAGRSRTQQNVYLPWSLTLTLASDGEVGTVRAASQLQVSKLNCSITTSDGTVLSSSSANAVQVSC